jgi:hypothetical protein
VTDLLILISVVLLLFSIYLQGQLYYHRPVCSAYDTGMYGPSSSTLLKFDSVPVVCFVHLLGAGALCRTVWTSDLGQQILSINHFYLSLIIPVYSLASEV